VPASPLPLVREYVLGQLEKLEGSRGEYLVGGVTLAALQPMRPVPFQIVYVLGLGEDLFPGSNAQSSFDLRGAGRSGCVHALAFLLFEASHADGGVHVLRFHAPRVFGAERQDEAR
jgi:hypothetical protein